MVSISMYRGNLHRAGAEAERRWPSPRRALSPGRFRRLVRSRSLAVARLAQPCPSISSPTTRLSGGAAEPAGRPEEINEMVEEKGVGKEEPPPPQQQQQQQQERQDEQQQGRQDGRQQQVEEGRQDEQEEDEEEEAGAVEDVDMDDAGEVVVGGDDAGGNGGTEEGQGESEGFDPNPEASYLDGIKERKRELNDKLDTLNKKKHDLVQMLKQVLNAEEEIRMRSMQASSRFTMPLPSENTADGSSVSRQVLRMTVDVTFSDVAGESDAGSNQGTPGRPLHHVHSISPSTASFARSPFGSLQHNSGHTPRSPATFSTASPSRFASTGHQWHPPAHPSISLPGSNFVASSPSPAASGGSSSVFREHRPPNST